MPRGGRLAGGSRVPAGFQEQGCPNSWRVPRFERGVELLGFSADDDLKPGDTLGDYRVLSLLGSGGMGEVYLADDAVHGRQVALKLIGQGRAEETRGRHFRHERKVLATLNHPHIARLYGSGVTDKGQAYIVMEYVEGERLDRYCQDRGLDVSERLALFRKVCAAVSYAHQNLVVHRDLKPANIRVTPEGEPKLLDFGIAKLLDPEGTFPRLDPTVTMQGAMTPEYASPEQIKGEPITTASDVYSLGVVLFELLTGQRPYAHLKSPRPDELARAICEEEPPRPSTVATHTAPTTTTGTVPATRLRRRLEGDLDNIVAKALRKEPGRRYPSVLALSEDIRRHCEGLPVTARKDTLGYRAGKFIRRNKVGVTAAAMVVLALITGLVTAIWQAQLARQERDRAQAALVQAKIAQKQAERIDDFLQGLLASADPVKLGKDVRMVQVIDAAAKNLDRDLANEPEVLIRAHQTLALTYQNLGLFEPAEQQNRAALAVVRHSQGTESPAAADAETTLAIILTNRGQAVEAESLLRHALSVQRAQAQPDRGPLGKTLTFLGIVIALQPDHFAEAEACEIEALGYARDLYGEHDPKYLRTLARYGNVALAGHNYAKAEGIYRQVLALQDQLPTAAGDALITQWNLCLCLSNMEKWDALDVVLQRFETDSRRLVGENSVQFGVAALFRGGREFWRGEYGAAILTLSKALGPLSASYPPDYLGVVGCQAQLGLCMTRDGRAAEGEQWLRTAYDHGGKVDRAGFDHSIGNLETALGECLLAQKRYAEAEPLLLTGHDDLVKRLGPQHRLTIQSTHRLHDLYLAWNKPDEAARFADNPTAQPSLTP